MSISFWNSLAVILSNLPQHPIGLIGLVVLLISFVCLTFFSRESARVKVAMFILLFLGGSLLSGAAIGLQIPSSIPPAKAEGGGVKPMGAYPFTSLPEHLEVLVFDATFAKLVGRKLARCLQEPGSGRKVDYLRNWMNEWQMEFTRIYYQGSQHRAMANEIARIIPGRQFVLDYNNQQQYRGDVGYWPEDHASAYSYMVGIDKTRDIIIFAGLDLVDWLKYSTKDACDVRT